MEQLLKDCEPYQREIYEEFIQLLRIQTGDVAVQTCDVAVQTCDVAVQTGDVAVLTNETIMLPDKVETLAFQLSLQIKALEARGFSLLFLQASDIWILDKQIYFIANLTRLVPLYKKDTFKILLSYPVDFSAACLKEPIKCIAPELLQMKALPFLMHRSAAYYSAALLCLHVMQQSLEELQGTKLFYFLERCLKRDPNERQCLFL